MPNAEALVVVYGGNPNHFHAIFFNLRYVTLHGFPSIYLSKVFIGNPPTHIISAIPLKPTPWVIWIDPAFLLPI